MKYLKTLTILAFLAATTALLVNTKTASASDGMKYEATVCTVYHPDGTIDLTFECIYPSAVGPCPHKQWCGAVLIDPE